MRVLVLGVSGMLGNAVFKQFTGDPRYQVWGTLRNASGMRAFPSESHERLICNIDVLNHDVLVGTLERLRPDTVINCIGLIKQLADAKDPLSALPVNAMLPHRLAHLCALIGARLVHVSTDCVFNGSRGMYKESDISDAEDLYGKSKHIGELHELPHAITLRTSIIGHELSTNFALIDWFLAQEGRVKGYKKAVFSGVPTVELARIMRDYVLPAGQLHGLYHVSANPIDKYSLLQLVANVYGKNIEILPDDSVSIDRSLDSSAFRKVTGYEPPAWPDLIKTMRDLR